MSECGLLFVSGVPRDSTLNTLPHLAFNYLTFQLFAYLLLWHLLLPPILSFLSLIRGACHLLELGTPD